MSGDERKEELLSSDEREEGANQAITPISFQAAVAQAAYYSSLPALIRALIATKSFTTAVIAGYLSEEAVAGFALATIFQQTLFAVVKGLTASVEPVVSNLEGQGKKDKIGVAVNQTQVLATVAGSISAALFFTSSWWLEAMGVEHDMAQYAGGYLRSYSYGFIPTCWAMVDQNFLLSLKRNAPAMAFSLTLVGLSMAIGYPMAIKTGDLNWLGYGLTTAGIITFLATRLYLYFNNDGEYRKIYQLFNTKIYDDEVSFESLIKLSIASGWQGFVDWIPTLLITFIIASDDSKNAAAAQAPSAQLLVALTQILLSLSSTAAILVSENLGKARKAKEEGSRDNEVQIAINNAKKMGDASIMVTTLYTLPVTLFNICYPRPLVKLLCKDEVLWEMAEDMLRITCASVIFDAMKNAIIGATFGRNQPVDNFFASLINVSIGAAAATVAGFYTQKELGALSFFVWKLVGICVTTAILGYYWEVQSKHLESKQSNLWCRFGHRTPAVANPIEDDKFENIEAVEPVVNVIVEQNMTVV